MEKAKKLELKICSNCVMDTTDSAITFDKNGVCDHCNTFYKNIQPNWNTDEKGFQDIQKICQKIKSDGKGKDFDCIIGELIK